MDEADHHFRVSAGLKNIIGSELITDDFVAVFELVKNSFDAHASEVVIEFQNLRNPKKAAIVIEDDGKGMTSEDLTEKWLFVAYSAKRDLTEDADLERHRDYRELIGKNRPFAGAKGIGRFSCDRLGRRLALYTRRDESKRDFEWLCVNWRDFEADAKQRFEDIRIHRGISEKERFGRKRGTRLRIGGLRSTWDGKKILELRKELQKLISPEEGAAKRKFRIRIVAQDEAQADKNRDADERINGEVRNFLFERLGLKTTKLSVIFAESGKTIQTELTDRDQPIYSVIEANTEYQELGGVRITLFYLNRAAKLAFTKAVGVEPVKFGSVFLYKNGIRVLPYGRDDDDSYEIARRKQQGTSRHFGTRDLFGRIQITADNRRFKEVSSRDGGLMVSEEREQLLSYFSDVALRRLETYVVDVIRWGNPPDRHDDESLAPTAREARNEVLELITRLTASENIVRFDANPDLLRIVNERQADGAGAMLTNFERIAHEHGDATLAKEATRLKREMKAVLNARAEAQSEAVSERKRRVVTEKQLATERQRNQILKELVQPPDEQRAILEHWVKLVADTIGTLAAQLIGKVSTRGGEAQPELLQGLAAIKLEADKLLTVSSLVTETGFDLRKQRVPGDLARYFVEYLDLTSRSGGPVRHEIEWDATQEFACQFRPVEIAMVVDNISSNAKKAGARLLRWRIEATKSELRVSVSNDGRPLAKHMEATLFELGATATHGSGLGLFTCRQVIRAMSGEITYCGTDPQLGGAIFEMKFVR